MKVKNAKSPCELVNADKKLLRISVYLAAKRAPFVYLLDDRDQVLKTLTHLKKRPEDQVKHLYLKDTEEKMNENPPRRAFVF